MDPMLWRLPHVRFASNLSCLEFTVDWRLQSLVCACACPLFISQQHGSRQMWGLLTSPSIDLWNCKTLYVCVCVCVLSFVRSFARSRINLCCEIYLVHKWIFDFRSKWSWKVFPKTLSVTFGEASYISAQRLQAANERTIKNLICRWKLWWTREPNALVTGTLCSIWCQGRKHGSN